MGEFAEMAMEQEMSDMFDGIFSEIFGGKKSPKRVNRFIEHRKVNDKVWLMRDKVEILITKMETDHIVKCLVLLTRAKQTDTKAYEGMMH
ncbi:hypothetical protein, partial [Methylotenera sp.]|uniref:hypothetical protein n=1 Tax=Methylotenera sp. TaxID=2051956 RepID=UPI002487C304